MLLFGRTTLCSPDLLSSCFPQYICWPLPPASKALGCCCCRRSSFRVRAQQQVDDAPQWQKRIRSAVPVLTPPDTRGEPPQEPPPPPPPPEAEGGAGRRGKIAAVAITLGLSFLWYRYYQSLMPQIYRDEYGIQFVKTKGGNQVAVAEDPRGRTFFIDKAGNLYYDTGDPSIGAYMVDRNEGVYNIWIDPQDQPQQKYVGQLSDLRAMDIRSFAGIPVRELQREFNGRFGGHLTFFNSPDEGRQLPPNAPVLKDKDGSIEGPPILEEGAF